MNEPDNHAALIDASGDTWVRVDEVPGQYGGTGWPITDGPGWEPWGRGQVGIARFWQDLAEYGPFAEADAQRTANALAKVREAAAR